jgi:hypothetical protein
VTYGQGLGRAAWMALREAQHCEIRHVYMDQMFLGSIAAISKYYRGESSKIPYLRRLQYSRKTAKVPSHVHGNLPGLYLCNMSNSAPQGLPVVPRPSASWGMGYRSDFHSIPLPMTERAYGAVAEPVVLKVFLSHFSRYTVRIWGVTMIFSQLTDFILGAVVTSTCATGWLVGPQDQLFYIFMILIQFYNISRYLRMVRNWFRRIRAIRKFLTTPSLCHPRRRLRRRSHSTCHKCPTPP